jgi:hypothetical protein
MEYKGNNSLIGQVFNQLTVLEYTGDSKWKCQCSCGNITYVKSIFKKRKNKKLWMLEREKYYW